MSRRRGGGDRRWRYAHQAKSQKRTAQQLVLTIVALVFLILFWKELSTGAAGCFTQMTAPQGQGQQAPASSGEEDSGDKATESAPAKGRDSAPSVRIKLPDKPAKPATP